jgi:hypothetical protein
MPDNRPEPAHDRQNFHKNTIYKHQTSRHPHQNTISTQPQTNHPHYQPNRTQTYQPKPVGMTLLRKMIRNSHNRQLLHNP